MQPGFPSRPFRTIRFLCLAAVFAYSLPQVSAQPVWFYVPSGTLKTLYAVGFGPLRTGYIAGQGGTILKSTDDGQSWTGLQSGTTKNLYAVSVLDAMTAVVAGEGGTLLRTTDGGITWSHVPVPTANNFHAVEMLSPVTIRVFGKDFFGTDDLGVTWFVDTLAEAEWGALKFFDQNNGILASRNVYHTTDGGVTWTSESPYPGAQFYAIGFLDPGTPVYGGTVNGAGLLHTVGGVGTPADRLFPQHYVYSIGISNSYDGRAFGAKAIWNFPVWGWWRIIQSTPETYYSNAQTGQIAVGEKGAIIKMGFKAFVAAYPPDSARRIGMTLASDGTVGVPLRWNYFPETDFTSNFHILVSQNDNPTMNPIISQDFDHIETMRGNDTTVVVGGLNLDSYYSWTVTYGIYGSLGYQHFFTILPQIDTLPRAPADSLLIADSIQLTDPSRWTLQRSAFDDSLVGIGAVCVIPEGTLTRTGPTALFYDTLSSRSTGRGILFQMHPSRPDQLVSVHTGELATLTGMIEESPAGNMNSMEMMIGYTAVSHGSAGWPVMPEPVMPDLSQFSSGMSVRYSTGEQYQGMLVEFHHLRAVSILDVNRGTILLKDSAGNRIATDDLSRWFTTASHRDPASTWSPPVNAMIDTLRGILTTSPATGYAVAPVYPGDVVINRASTGVISGSVYEDFHRDGLRDGADTGFSGWLVTISGGQTTGQALTDANGRFVFRWLDTGWYSLTAAIPQPYIPTYPANDTLRVHVGLGQSIGNVDLGATYPWNVVSGAVFEDRNENGTRDAGEPGIAGIRVIGSGQVRDTSLTDSLGRYTLYRVGVGTDTVHLVLPQGWEEIAPNYPAWYELYLADMNLASAGFDFSLRKPPKNRVRIKLTVMDNIGERRDLYWGFRQGATAGIWGVDPDASIIDFAEGEFELPPVSGSFFDARFVGSYGRFGGGSWTDIRGFRYVNEIDTSYIDFVPGYLEGGNYPMTISWSPDSVAANFTGPVFLTDKFGGVTQMKGTGSLTVSDSRIFHLALISQGPRINPELGLRWRLLSVPRPVSDSVPHGMTLRSLFPNLGSTAFGFGAGSSSGMYTTSDTMLPGLGYWIKCSNEIDTTQVSGISQGSGDTIRLSAGWNLVGAPDFPCRSGEAVETIPPGILTGAFVGYSNRYQFTDSLLPYHGYWTKSLHDGEMVLRHSRMLAADRPGVSVIPDDWLRSHAGLEIGAVISGNDTSYLYLGTGRKHICDGIPESRFDLPPLPPECPLDIRWRGDRGFVVLDTAEADAGFSVDVNARTYPVRLFTRGTVPGSMIIRRPGGEERIIPVTSEGSGFVLQNHDESLRYAPSPAHNRPVPDAFGLDQNFPNPGNASTTIRYRIPVECHVTLRIFNLLGQEVASLVDADQGPGVRTAVWPVDGATGLYFYRMVAAAKNSILFTQSRKLLIVR